MSSVEEILNQKIENQREEIKRLRKCLNDTTQSRNYWKNKAKCIGKQFQQILDDRRKEDTEKRIYALYHKTEKGCEQE